MPLEFRLFTPLSWWWWCEEHPWLNTCPFPIMQLAVALCSFPGRVLGSEVRPRKFRYAFHFNQFSSSRLDWKLPLTFHFSITFFPTAVTIFFPSLTRQQNAAKLRVVFVLRHGTRAAPFSPTIHGSVCGTLIFIGNVGLRSVWDLTIALFRYSDRVQCAAL